jgi:hypothetical protein
MKKSNKKTKNNKNNKNTINNINNNINNNQTLFNNEIVNRSQLLFNDNNFINNGLIEKPPIMICGILYQPKSVPRIMSSGTKNSRGDDKNYGDSYSFPINYPSVSEMQSAYGISTTNLGPIPF